MVHILGVSNMRYLIHESQQSELAARQEYLYDLFHMYFLPGNPEGGYIPLYPVVSNSPDILFITGHVGQVNRYLEATIGKISEQIIVITSCFGVSFRKISLQKTIYVPSVSEALCPLHDGRPYGFAFNISDAELNLYNSRGDIIDRIQASYIRL